MSETLGAPAIHSLQVSAGNSQLYLIGDTIERFDAIGGLGMTHAVFSAGLAAKSIITENGPASYYRQRSAGARTLRALTALSYGLNVAGSFWQRSLVSSFPGMSYSVMEAIKRTFPEAPHVPAISQAADQTTFFPVQFRSTHVEEHV
jgi:flavin-dependent dehydrogenase